MAGVLVVYGTRHGQSERVANRVADVMREEGLDVATYPVDRAPDDLDLSHRDGVIVISPVYFGHHLPVVEAFARRHRSELARVPSVFLSVCGALAEGWAQGPAEAAAHRRDMVERTGWEPDVAHSVAGAVPYTSYGWPTRMVMREISRRTGRPTDTSRDWEFTDWAVVEHLARELAGLMAPALVPA